jgi:hypothetical protein
MITGLNLPARLAGIALVSLASVSCVTETVDSPNSVRFTDTAVIAVQDPYAYISQGSTVAWLPDAVNFYQDERLANSPMKALIEKAINRNLQDKELVLVESVNGAKFSIAYTAALESSLDDSAIIRRFGLLPGNSQVPTGDSNIEKGSLIIYMFENRSGDIIWRSASQVGVKFDTPENERKKRVETVLAEMFQTLKVTE